VRRALAVCLVLAVLAALGGRARRDDDAAAGGPADAERVAREWSIRLNADDHDGVAQLFALPSTASQGGSTTVFVRRGEVREWFAGLPCSGTIVAVEPRLAAPAPDGSEVPGAAGVLAVFELGDRPGSTCDAPGELAAAEFDVAGGLVVAWRQVGVPPEYRDATTAKQRRGSHTSVTSRV
jgi:hypothetical protein